jgi:hypothetical protein
MVSDSKNEPIPEEVIRKFKAKKGESWSAAFFCLMKELHCSSDELLEMPISRINVLLLEMKNHSEREQKEMKKARKK